MANQTTNYGLQKPLISEKVDVNVFNQNMDTIDTNMKSISDKADNKANSSDLTSHTTNTSNPHSVTKSQIGLGNVENKSSSTIRGEITKSNVTTALGYTPAELDSTGKVLSSQLPSFVDDVVDGYLNSGKFYKENTYTTEIIGEESKIYIDLSNNKTYRWSGSAFVLISETISLGETSSTAYRGDRGKIAYDHSQSTHAPTNAEENVIESVKVNGTALTITNKAVDVKCPTKVSELTNDSGYKTTDNNTTYSLSKSGSTITLTGSDGSTSSVVDSDTNTTYSTGDATTPGLTKLYTGTGTNTDGTMTQKAISDALDGKSSASHTHSQYANQNAFSNVTVGSTTIEADTTTDTLTLVAGSNVTITPDSTNDKITISSSHDSISTSTDSTSTASPSAGGTFTAVDSITRDSNGHVTKINTKTVTLPSSGGSIPDGVTYVDLSETSGTIDTDVMIGSANLISYSNSTSELTANNVQSAIDELVDNSQTKTGDTADNTTTFTSNDSTTATSWTDVSAVTSGETHKSFFNKISTMFKNIRYLYNKLGTTDISAIGDGSVTGALNTLNSNLVA